MKHTSAFPFEGPGAAPGMTYQMYLAAKIAPEVVRAAFKDSTGENAEQILPRIALHVVRTTNAIIDELRRTE